MVDGRKLAMTIPGPVSYDWRMRLKGQGMPTSLKTVPNARGDLILRVESINYPASLTAEQSIRLSEIFGVKWYESFSGAEIET